MQPLSRDAFIARLLSAERAGSGDILAFYDSTVDAVCTDGQLLLIPLSDHLCHRGDALFESISVRGGYIYALKEHIDRMRKGAASFMQLEPPVPWERIPDIILDVVRAGGQRSCNLRVFLGRGAGGFGVSPFDSPKTSLYIVALRQDPPSPAFYEKGMTAFTSSVPPKQEYLATVKTTNYVPNVLMDREARRKNMDCAVTFYPDGAMGEAAVANIGIIDRDGALVCPPLDRVLAGTCMLCALRVAARRMPVRQGPVTHEDIAAAREMLLFTSSKLCVAITHFDGVPIGSGRPGPVSRWLLEEMRSEVMKSATPVWKE